MGVYTVKSAYKLLEAIPAIEAESSYSGLWRKLWNLKISTKVRFFLWQASSGCLPTKSQLQTRHVPVDAVCPLCQLEV